MKLLLCTLALAATVSARSRVSALKDLMAQKGAKGAGEDEAKAMKAMAQDEAKTMAHMFSFAEGAEDSFTIKVSTTPTQIPFASSSQVRTWNAISEESPMTKQGYTQWLAAQKGFLFKNADSTKHSMCENSGITSKDAVMSMSFKCKEVTQTAAQPTAAAAVNPTAAAVVDPTAAAAAVPTAAAAVVPTAAAASATAFIAPIAVAGATAATTAAASIPVARFQQGNKVNPMGAMGGMNGVVPTGGFPYSSYGAMGDSQYIPINTMPCYGGNFNQMCTAWQSCSGGMPYASAMGQSGYDTGAFNYPYYAVNSMGYWGCPSLSMSGSFCSTNPFYYPLSP